MKNLHGGIAVLDDRGELVIEFPLYFEALNADFRYKLFPIGAPMESFRLKKEKSGNVFSIEGGIPGGKVSWQVTTRRHDPYAQLYPIQVEVEKGQGELVDKRECLHEEGCAEVQ